MKTGSSITIRTLFATNRQQFHKELDSGINIPNKALMLKQVLNSGAKFDQYLKILKKMFNGFAKVKKG